MVQYLRDQQSRRCGFREEGRRLPETERQIHDRRRLEYRTAGGVYKPGYGCPDGKRGDYGKRRLPDAGAAGYAGSL